MTQKFQPEPIVIVAAKRTPMTQLNGAFAQLAAPMLAQYAIKAACAQAGFEAQKIDHIFMGCVLTAGVGQAPARQAALLAGCKSSAPAVTINKVCGSSLQSVIFAVQACQLYRAECVLAGGMENIP